MYTIQSNIYSETVTSDRLRGINLHEANEQHLLTRAEVVDPYKDGPFSLNYNCMYKARVIA